MKKAESFTRWKHNFSSEINFTFDILQESWGKKTPPYICNTTCRLIFLITIHIRNPREYDLLFRHMRVQIFKESLQPETHPTESNSRRLSLAFPSRISDKLYLTVTILLKTNTIDFDLSTLFWTFSHTRWETNFSADGRTINAHSFPLWIRLILRIFGRFNPFALFPAAHHETNHT